MIRKLLNTSEPELAIAETWRPTALPAPRSGAAMARVVVVTGATRTPASPLVLSCEATVVQEANSLAAEAAGLPWLPDRAFGRASSVSVFVNGAALLLTDGPQVKLADGDVLALECPATDT